MDRTEMIARLEKLADEMSEVGAAMDYYGGFSECAKHGAELVSAAAVVGSWVEAMKAGQK